MKYKRGLPPFSEGHNDLKNIDHVKHPFFKTPWFLPIMTTIFKKQKYIEFLYTCIEIWEKIYLDFWERLFLVYFETVGSLSFIIYMACKIVDYIVQSFCNLYTKQNRTLKYISKFPIISSIPVMFHSMAMRHIWLFKFKLIKIKNLVHCLN